MPTFDELARELGELKANLEDLRTESRANAGTLSAAIRKTRSQVAEQELLNAVRRGRPSAAALLWDPRGGEFINPPDLGSSLIDRLRTGNAVADSTGNVQPGFGPASVLVNPTLEGIGTYLNSTIPIGLVQTDIGWGWSAHYVLNSGTITGGVPEVTEQTRRTEAAGGEVQYNSSVIDFGFPSVSGPFDADVYFYQSEVVVPAALGVLSPYLVAAVRLVLPASGNGFTGTTVSDLTLEIVDETTSLVVASSEALDIRNVSDLTTFQLDCAVTFGVTPPGDNFRWRLRLHVVQTGATGRPRIGVIEPQFARTYTKDPSLYKPQIGNWSPRIIGSASFVRGPDDLDLDIIYDGDGRPTSVRRYDDGKQVSRATITYAGDEVDTVVTERFAEVITASPVYSGGRIIHVDRVVA